GSMFGGPLGGLVGGLVGALGTLLVKTLPDDEKSKELFKNMLPPKEKAEQEAMKVKLANVTNELQDAIKMKEDAEAAGAGRELILPIQQRIEKLLEQSNEINVRHLQLTEDTNQEIKDNAFRASLAAGT